AGLVSANAAAHEAHVDHADQAQIVGVLPERLKIRPRGAIDREAVGRELGQARGTALFRRGEGRRRVAHRRPARRHGKELAPSKPAHAPSPSLMRPRPYSAVDTCAKKNAAAGEFADKQSNGWMLIVTRTSGRCTRPGKIVLTSIGPEERPAS